MEGFGTLRPKQLMDLLMEEPVIAAVKSDSELEQALTCKSRVVFVLYGDILRIADLTRRIKASGKAAFLHVDLVDGLSPREVAVDFVKEHTCADGIITTKAALVHRAHEKKLVSIQRFFLLDSLALRNLEKQLGAKNGPDLVEILPGAMPKIIRRVADSIGKPVIAGGLISDKEDILQALGAGASAISSTDPHIWQL